MKPDRHFFEGLNALLRAGDTDQVISRLDRLDSWILGDEAVPMAQEVRWEVQARAAQGHLLSMKKGRAIRCLAPFIDVGEPHLVTISRKEVLALRDARGHAFARGLLLGVLANLLSRCFRYEEGVRCAQWARNLLRQDSPGVEEGDRLLAELENRVWLARLLRHVHRGRDAEALLTETLEDVSKRLDNESIRGGLDLIAALALDLQSSFDLKAGHLEEAERKIYQALFLLREGGRANTSVRLAHAHYMAGRILASRDRSSAIRCKEHFDLAAQLFARLNHDFQFRTLVQKAQFSTKAGPAHEARHALLDIDRQLKKRKAIGDPVEADEEHYIRADLLLTEIWLDEAEARQEPSVWEDCRRKARELVSMRPKPERLEIEGLLHLGLALVHSEQRTDLVEGRELFEQVSAEAKASGMTKVQVAAAFGLAESYLGPDRDLAAANRHWHEGVELMSDVRSGFLSDWRKRLAPRLIRPTVEIELGQDVDGAIEDLLYQYLSFHESTIKHKKDLWEQLGVSQAKGYRLLQKLRELERRRDQSRFS